MDDRVKRIDGESWKGNASGGSGITVINLTTASPTYQMKPSDTVVYAYSAAADAIGIITLPSLAESAGQHYFIIAPTGATAGDISLYEKETGAELAINGDMDADNDHLILFSTGISWLTRLDGVA